MTFDEMSDAITSATHTLRLGDRMASRLASILVGRLRCVESIHALKKLKMELRDFNAHTGEWK